MLSSFFKDNWKDIFWGTDFLTETLAEFGLSFFSVVNIFSLIPTQIDFYKGYTFFAMIPTIFPIGWAFPEFFAKASISNIVNPIIGYPVGATMFGDFYGNFSYIGGILACFLFAYIFTVSFTPKFKDVGLSNTIYYSMFFVYTNLIRATFFEMFRSFFILIVITIVVYKLTKTKGELIV
ncbi:hypothetical protein A5886_003111 [Enterococcus sp. 8G7_MSG3316]|uniref:Uncharacterized protein n=1 Tax=Candidatus Enterococcus testudinis TaxID=1834191 RepID=A0A242A0X5_9ENTE|nr:hypothetical protein A5886_003111 [Enterococcus sp. 8G7_MSG3316]